MDGKWKMLKTYKRLENPENRKTLQFLWMKMAWNFVLNFENNITQNLK